MVEENKRVLDEGTWQIVYSFFHPEDGVLSKHGKVSFAGVFAPIGISEDSCPDTVAAPNFYSGRPACLVWAADENEDEKNFWRAEIMVTSGLGISESVIINVTDSHGENIDAATLILLNSTLEVRNGAAEYSLAEFQRNLSNTNVALIYPDGRRVLGNLSLCGGLL